MSTRTRSGSRPAADPGPARRRAYLAFTLAFPFLFFLLLEAALRMLHYGPDLALFATEKIGGRTYHVMNPAVKSRYFADVAFSPNTSSDYFLVPKPPGTFRIFCLGGSTTVGFPYGFTGSFSSHLRNRLRTLFPDRPVEVINLGMTATNSTTVLDLARELPAYEPDLVIVYDGHNEFYGALGVASHERTGGSVWLNRLTLKLVHWRTFLLLRDLYRHVRESVAGGGAQEMQGTMMERMARGQEIPMGSDTYHEALAIFRRNLSDLGALCRTERIPLVLATQVSNLRGQPPFVSAAVADPAFAAALERGRGALAAGRPEEALGHLREAVGRDSLHAGAWYAAARALDTLGRRREARTAYERARDCDMLRFRASGDFNGAIREAAGGEGTFLADAEAAFAAASPDSITGYELILEHLHPNARGYFLIAREYARVMSRNGLLAPEAVWAARDTVPEETHWQRRHLTRLDEALAARRVLMLTSQWPFTGEPRPLPPVPPGDPLAAIVEKMALGALTWEEGHVAAAEVYAASGDFASAEAEARALVNQLPVNVSASLLLAQTLIRAGKLDEALAVLERSLALEETVFARRSAGSILLDGGDAAAAVAHLERAWALSATRQERNENGYLLALAFSRAGMADRARTQLQTLLTADPDYAPARALLRRLER